MAALYNTRWWYIRQYVFAPARMRECAYARSRAPCRARMCTPKARTCVDTHTYLYIDTTERVHTERGVLCTARGRYCRQERLSGAHNPFTSERATNGRNRPRTTRRDDMCVPVLHPFLGFTFRRVFRRLDIALLQTLRCERVRLLYILISISLFLSFSLFLVPRASRCSFTLFHIFIAARCRHIHALRFCVPSPPPPPILFPSRKPLPPSLSSILLYSLLPSFILRPSFDLTRPDRPVHVYSRNNYIQPGSFFR